MLSAKKTIIKWTSNEEMGGKCETVTGHLVQYMTGGGDSYFKYILNLKTFSQGFWILMRNTFQVMQIRSLECIIFEKLPKCLLECKQYLTGPDCLSLSDFIVSENLGFHSQL
jgi:hypothetical protein